MVCSVECRWRRKRAVFCRNCLISLFRKPLLCEALRHNSTLLTHQRWSRADSNRRHPGCKPGALPTELRPQIKTSTIHNSRCPLSIIIQRSVKLSPRIATWRYRAKLRSPDNRLWPCRRVRLGYCGLPVTKRFIPRPGTNSVFAPEKPVNS